MALLRAVDVNKSIKGAIILKDINLELYSGNVYGFVGRNGSGKTMLFRTLAGLIRPSSGKIYLDDKELHRDMSCLPSVGVVIENVGLYHEFTGMENLKFLAKIKNKIGDTEIRRAIERVGLDPDDKRSFKKYSLGMKQRIVLAQAIMEKPDIILLDEPTNSLDENGIELIRGIVNEERQRGALILIASHNKEDIELLCQKVFYLKNGMVVEERGQADL
jgi:ABC-2 type transport system ATP-binding protein